MRAKRTSSALPQTSREQGLSPAERSLRARLAAHTMHARHDPRETTTAARAAFLARFEAEADPDGVLPPEERRRRAEHLRRAHFARLSLKAVEARRVRRAEARAVAAGVDAEGER